MIVAGLDLSLTSAGVAVLTDGKVTVLKSPGWCDESAASEEERSDRVVGQTQLICSLVPRDADLVMIEKPLYKSTTGHAFDRAGLWRGVYANLRVRGTQIGTVHLSTLKMWSTGKSRAEKDVILEATQQRWPDIHIRNDDQADALSLAEIGAVKLGENLPFTITERHRNNLQSCGITWPTAWAQKEAV